MAREPLAETARFEKIRNLGCGAHGVVQLARNTQTGEHVAIKFIQRGWDKKLSKYVLRELLNHQELSAVKHPHIVEFKEVFVTTRYLAVVMEYVEGDNLQKFLEKMGGKLAEGLARFIFQQLIIAVDFCHQKGKINRDLKLANTLLLLTPGQLPLVKLCDFGFSKDKYYHSDPQSQVGTALFVAPEVMHNFSNQSYDGQAADVWACGVILFITLFGKHPFLRTEDCHNPQNIQIVKLFQRVVNSDYYISPQEASSVSVSCLDLLQRILVADPAHRFTMAQIQQHPWFHEAMPCGASMMNTHYLAKESTVGGLQSAVEIEQLVQAAEVFDIRSLTGQGQPSASIINVPSVTVPPPIQVVHPSMQQQYLGVNSPYSPAPSSGSSPGNGFTVPGDYHGMGDPNGSSRTMSSMASAFGQPHVQAAAPSSLDHMFSGRLGDPGHMTSSNPNDLANVLPMQAVMNMTGGRLNSGMLPPVDSHLEAMNSQALELSLFESSLWHKICQDLPGNVR